MTTLAPAGCQILEWDSEFFGVTIGRGSLPVQAADECAREIGLDCLYLLIPIEEMGEAHEAVRLGFRLVDVRVEFTVPARSVMYEYRAGVRKVGPGDISRVTEIAMASFRRTRFYNDPQFDDGLCDLLYAKWIENAIADDTTLVFVAERDRDIAGFVTLTGGKELGLIAVDERFRRQGVGRALMHWVIDAAHLSGEPSFSVVTQGGNLPAQRLFQAAGGRSISVGLWFHLWL